MDLKVFYKKIREAAALIPADFTVLASLETPDGGKAGVMSEVPRAIAARMIVEGRARTATVEETEAFYAHEEELRLKAERELAPARLQVAVMSEKDIEAFTSGRSTSQPKSGK